MHGILVANTIMSGFMFALWKKDNVYNCIFKMGFLVLMIFNIIALTKF